MTKQEIIERLNKVCEASQNARFTIEARITDWENYGKFQSTHPSRGATLYIVFYTEPQHRQRADYSKKMNFLP